MPIRVKVLYFGQAKEAAGTSEEEVLLPEASSVGVLIRESGRNHRALSPMARTVRVAVNEEVAEETQRLENGDIVAFLPPVAGG